MENTSLIIRQHGGKVEPRNLNRSFKRIRKKAGLCYQIPNNVRHACASLLGELGEDPRTVMEILGHAKMPVTVEIYQRASRKARRRVLLRLERKVGVRDRWCQRLASEQTNRAVNLSRLPALTCCGAKGT